MKRLGVLAALLALTGSYGSAQGADARAVLQAAVTAMGGANLKTIEYSGAGWFSRIGQTYGLAEDWPKYEVTGYTRRIDYDAKWSREDFTRRQGNYPLLGGTPSQLLIPRSMTVTAGAHCLRGDLFAGGPRPRRASRDVVGEFY